MSLITTHPKATSKQLSAQDLNPVTYLTTSIKSQYGWFNVNYHNKKTKTRIGTMPKLTLSFKGQAISVHRLQDGHTLIGRDPDCDIAIDSLAVAPRHAKLITEAEACRVVALDEKNPILVNEKEIEEVVLSHGDVLRLGKHILMFASDAVSLSPQTSETDATDNGKQSGKEHGATYLQILSGEHIGRIIPVTRNMIRIGKAGGDCAIIAHRGNGYYLSHLEGTAPTVDGVPIGEESVMLTKGSTIRISNTELQFYC